MSNPRLPNRLNIACTVNGKPLSDELVCITIKTRRKNNFPLAFGPTDQHGHITVSREELIKQAMNEKRLAQMDFGDPEYDFIGEIEITPLGPTDIDNALSAYKLFRDAGGYPRNWVKSLKAAKKSLGKLPLNSTIVVEAHGEGDQIRLKPVCITVTSKGK